MTDIARLRAHAALHEALTDEEQQQWGCDLREAADEIERLRLDAARYRWLRDKLSRIGVNVNPGWDAEQSETTKIESLWVMEHFRATDPESTDIAIDAAMKA